VSEKFLYPVYTVLHLTFPRVSHSTSAPSPVYPRTPNATLQSCQCSPKEK
jgi:hypothetical protein